LTLYGSWPQPSAHVGQVTVRRDVCPAFDPAFRRTEDVDWWLSLVERSQPVELPFVGYELRGVATRRLTASPDDEETKERMLRLLSRHEAWFDARPDAAAFNWQRAGLAARDPKCLWRSFRIRPKLTTLLRMAEVALPERVVDSARSISSRLPATESVHRGRRTEPPKVDPGTEVDVRAA
jgi:hypothetical protein